MSQQAANALDKYSSAVKELKAHISENKPVFDAHEKLTFRVIDAENELRDAVAEAGAGVSNDSHSVIIEPQTQVIADIEVIDKLIQAGKILVSRDEIVKTNQRPPRITISEQR